jgi:putative ABC transport system permease protein
VLVNETFVKTAKWKNPIGQEVDFFWDNRKMKVIGVVKDHHFSSVTQAIEPQLMTMLPGNPYGMAFIRIRPGSDTRALAHIATTFKSIFPTKPYSYTFRADANRNAYEAEAKWKQMLLFGAMLTIFISCIGLFGLSVLNAEKRVKEVGIRKVLGASVQHIAGKLTVEYLQLVSISLVVAMPLAWLAINKWLQLYPYRISIGFSLFALAAGIIILLAVSTVSFQALRAAMSNPVKNLRTE